MKTKPLNRRTLFSVAGKSLLLHTLLTSNSKAAPVSFQKTVDKFEFDLNNIWIGRNDVRWLGLSQAFNQDVKASPIGITLCRTWQDAVGALNYCQMHSLPFSIRSGGHCYMGFSLADQGVVIDLSLMNQIIPIDNNSVRVEAGCTIGEVYSVLFKQSGKCIPAGSCESVGISGFTLGGGIGWLNRLYGLTSDVLKNIEIIVPVKDGFGFEKVNASPTNNPDLFWACRGGGGGNFGLVSSFEFQVHPVPQGNTVFFEIQLSWLEDDEKDDHQLKLIMGRWMAIINDFNQKAVSNTDYRYFFSSMTIFSRNNGSGISVSGWSFHDDLVTARQIYHEFIDSLNLNNFPLANIQENLLPYWEVIKKIGYGGPSRHFYNNSGFSNSIISDEGLAVISELILSRRYSTAGAQNLLQIDSLGGKTAEYSSDFSAWPHREAQFSLQFESYWTDISDKQGCIQWTDDFFEKLTPYLTGYCYRNYPNPVNNQHIERYYGKNMEKLIQVKQKWDPDNFFNISQGIPVKTSTPLSEL